MNSQFEIESNSQFQSTIETLGVESLISSANIGSSFVFATNDFYPLYYNFDTNDYMTFHGKLKIHSVITCIDISDNKKYVVTGHENGMISLWSISDNFSFIKTFQKAHTENTAITHVKFGHNSEIIYVGDEKGIVTQVSITVIIKTYSFREVLIYDGSNVKNESNTKNRITSIVVSRQDDPFPIGFIVYENYYVSFDPSVITRFNFGSSDKQLILHISPKQNDRPIISLFSREIDFFMNLSIGSSIQMFQIRNPTTIIPLLSDINLKDDLKIINSFFLSSSLIALILSNGSIQLMLYNGEIVSKNSSDKLTQILTSDLINFSCFNEKVCIVNQKNVFWITFANWETTILNMAKEGKWDAAFQSLSEINLDLSCNLIGVPQNLAVRHRKVADLSRLIILQYIKKDDKQSQRAEDLINKIASVTVNIITLNLTSIMIDSIYPFFVSNHKEKEFFEGIKQAGQKHFVLFCTPEFVTNYIECSSSSLSSLNQCEDYLVNLDYQISQVSPLVKVAVKYKFLRLIRRFYIDYLHDCVSPCIFYYENNQIIEYIDFIFDQSIQVQQAQNEKKNQNQTVNDNENEKKNQNQTVNYNENENQNQTVNDNENEKKNQNQALSENEKKNLSLSDNDSENRIPISDRISESKSKYFSTEKRMKVRQAAVIVWLLIPEQQNGEIKYTRFQTFCKSNWSKALSYVTIFAKLITSIKIHYSFTDTLDIEALIDAVLQTVDGEDYSRAEPFLAEIMPFVSRRKSKIGIYSLRHILTWIFESNGSVSDRESALRIVVQCHPDLIPKNLLIQYCQYYGFVSFLKDHFMQEKSYIRIVEAMLINEEQRHFIIDFLKELLDKTKNSDIQDKERNEIKQNVKISFLKVCQPLLLIDEEKFVAFVVDNFSQNEINDLIDILKPQLKLVFLLRLRELSNIELTEDQKMKTFELLLRFRPSQAEQFLTENLMDINIDKARELSIKYNRIDCQVMIKIYLQQYNEAAQQISTQIEKNLLDFIESDSTENPSSIDELVEMKDMKPCMEIINTAIHLLTTISKDSKNKMVFQKGYFCFLFPMYLAQKSGKENIKQSVTLMFSYFVVGSMNVISPHHAFLIISIHFSHLDNDMYILILQNITARINYQKRLLNSLDELLVDDCLGLIDKVFLRKAKGIAVNELCCCVCRGKIESSQYETWYIYPCGHICHQKCYNTVIESFVSNTKKLEENKEEEIKKEKEVKNLPNNCPACFFAQEDQKNVLKVDDNSNDMKNSNLTTREVKRIQRRLQFALKKNFGNEDDLYKSLNSAYFSKAPEYPAFEEEPEIEINNTLPPPESCKIVIKKE